VGEGSPFGYSAAATDNPADSLTFAWELDGDALYDDASFTPGRRGGTRFSAGATSLDLEGVYTLGVRVSDEEGGEVTGTFDVTVENDDPVLEALVGSQNVLVGASFGFWADATDPGPQDVLTFEWDLDGDGQYDDLSEVTGSGAQSSSGQTSLGAAGIHVLGVRVIDAEGGEVTGSFEVEVVQLPAGVPALSSRGRALLIVLLAAAALLARRRPGAAASPR